MAGGRPKKTTDDVLLKSAEMLGWALGGLEREISQARERLNTLTAQAERLRQRVGSGVTSRATAVADATKRGSRKVGRKRRQMSAEAKQRISDMMKKRWAERRKKGA